MRRDTRWSSEVGLRKLDRLSDAYFPSREKFINRFRAMANPLSHPLRIVKLTLCFTSLTIRRELLKVAAKRKKDHGNLILESEEKLWQFSLESDKLYSARVIHQCEISVLAIRSSFRNFTSLILHLQRPPTTTTSPTHREDDGAVVKIERR